MARCEGTREDGKLSNSKPGSPHDEQHDDDGAGVDGKDQAVRAAIEKMAEEGEVYTGVFTQVAINNINNINNIT